MHERIGALVLAAGKGTRMKSDAPKVLQTLLGEPMLAYGLDALAGLFGPRVLAVIGHRAALVEAAFPDMAGRFVLQAEQLGTGHALAAALPFSKLLHALGVFPAKAGLVADSGGLPVGT